jgi:hypothetical protein
VVKKFLEDFGESGEEAYRAVGCRDIRRFAGFSKEDDLSNFPLIGEVFEVEGSIEKLGDVFDANRRKFLEDFTRDEVVARASFERKVIDDCLNFGLFESVERGSS